MSILVYKYGLLRPTQNEVRVREQLWSAHRYRNKLVEIERNRRTTLRALYSSHVHIDQLEQAVLQVEAEVEAAEVTVRRERSKTQSRSDTADMRNTIKTAKAKRKEARGLLREARTLLRDDPAVVAGRAIIDEQAAQARRDARAACGTYWGTYLLIESSDEQARKAPLYGGAAPNDPRFARWKNEGRLGVQIQGGALGEDILGGHDTRLRIDSIDERAWHSEVRGERRLHSRTTLSIRIGSDENRDPIWGQWPMIMHRPLPKGATIKNAVVSLHRVGPRERWTVQFTVDVPEATHTTCGKGAVAIDLGWRVMGDAIRVGTWRGEDGEHGELLLPSNLIGSLRKPHELRSVRDMRFNLARDSLFRWLATQADLPDWCRESTKTLSHWRSPARLAALALRWRGERFDGDAETYKDLEAWRYKDYHLWEWETSQWSKALGHRREIYRVFAAKLAHKYETVVLEDFDLSHIALVAPTETEKSENEAARGNRQLAAVSELRSSLINAFRSRGGVAAEVNARDTTRTCNICGLVEKFDAAAYVHHACTGCQAVWDQDDNATVVLLARWREGGGGDKTPGTAREGSFGEKTESRWARAKRMKTAKTDKKGTARNVSDKAAE